MGMITNFQMNFNSYASASASASNSFAPGGCQCQQANPMMNMLQGMGMLFAGFDMIDNGQLDGSIFKMLGGGQQQQAQAPMAQAQVPGAYAAAGPNGAYAQAGAPAQTNPYQPQQAQQYPQQQQQQMNPMQMIMQMMMMMMQMLMQMMGMGQQQQQQPQQAQQQQPQQAQQQQQMNPMQMMQQMLQQFMQALMGGQQQQQANSPFGNSAAAAASGNGAAAAAASGNGAAAAAAAGPWGASAAASAGGSAAAAAAWSGGSGVSGTALGGARGAWGDPHYDIAVDKNGNGKLDAGESAKFDHKGKDGHTYNVFEGDGVQVKGKYVPHSDPKAPQVIGETEVTAGQDKFNLTKDGKASLNGQDLNMKNGEVKQLADGTKIEKVNDKEYKVITKDGDGSAVNIKAGGNQMEVDPEGNFNNLGGIIGDAMTKVMNGEKMPGNEYWEKYDLGQVL